jgi:phage shock protein PspC (stress-responsive transcriptional regulator)
MTENTTGSDVPPTGADDPQPPAGQATQTIAPGAPPPHDSGPRVSGEEMRDLTRLTRSSTDKHVAGVAGGIARHLDIDPVIVRVAFVVLTFFGGSGLLVYGACWLLLPVDNESRAKVDLDPRSRSVALMVVGALAVLATIGEVFGDGWGGFWFPFPVLVVGGIAWWLLSRRDRRRERYAARYAAAYAQPQWVGTSTGWVGAPAATTPPPGTPGSGYGPPVPSPLPPRPPGYRDPRKRGPLLFWIAVPLIPLALGLLGMADLAGADVADSAYPALALGIVATMLMIGAFWGRAGGLILLGLIATLVTAGVTASEKWDGDEKRVTPTSAAAVESSYDLDGPGELVLDLTRVVDRGRLNGRTIELDVGVGRIEVIVPEGVNVTVDAEVGGAGDISIFGEHEEGLHVESDGAQIVEPEGPELHIDAFIGVGEIEVRTR